jgi:excinuclease ABC subunit B
MDNRPLKFENSAMQNQLFMFRQIPADYELQSRWCCGRTRGFVPQDYWSIEIRPSLNQIDDLIEEIQVRWPKLTSVF